MTKLKHISTLPPEGSSQKECNKALKGFHQKLFELQNVFYADASFALLVIVQGIDTSGKDGTIRHVMTSMNPMGVQVKSFKQPTTEELSHDFLWRIFPHFPAKGMIQVFNRSYYEDVIVPSIEGKLSKDKLHHRFRLINDLEQHLKLSNIHVLKFFLHISRSEQKKRIKERMDQPHKRWKYSKDDEVAADKWADYMSLYDMLIDKCGNNEWQLIPSDKRWYRNFAVAKALTNHLESLHLKYPK